ncbi:hypothetical protein LCM4577_23490 [Mesorhizobium sp. LCM 4577]|uniref:Uncharacterized protein n=1 Tax=Mesorhizobium plurifarium TaxID=69974 RepID=A0A090GT46_MESPL|nr:hypothetical protein [Mesorhizobium sp. LCM 4577]OHV69041.1 hypothetical protein LCM4577_23490 [Mesorhizobium sp. LCM 4577]CDX52095.1 conserved hypothetical protein [Mesorhizobium plurifarium]
MTENSRPPETRDVWPGTLLLFAGGLVAFLLVASGLLYALFVLPPRWPPPGAAWRSNDATPKLSTAPGQELASTRKEENAELNKLGWVDRTAGIARIPIDDAMKLVVRNGLPVWDKPAAAQGECALLSADVPRSKQAQQCRDTTTKGTAQ